MKNKIEIKYNNYVAYVEIVDSWDEVKYNVLGAVHRVLLACDENKDVTGVIKQNN